VSALAASAKGQAVTASGGHVPDRRQNSTFRLTLNRDQAGTKPGTTTPAGFGNPKDLDGVDIPNEVRQFDSATSCPSA
jgi:hypothetical protein